MHDVSTEKLHKGKFWLKLDNAAKIFPGQNTGKWSNVFRLSVTLKSQIQPELLERALIMTLPRFPCFDVRIRRGFFWYYFEKAELPAPPLMPDINNPCHRIKFSENNRFLFRIYYYKNRISVEFFHALADGHGACVFLSTLTAQYLRLLGFHIPSGGMVLDINTMANEGEIEDSFSRFANSKVKAKRAENFVYHRKGQKMPAHRVNITTGYMPLKQLLDLSRSNAATITEYLASVLMYIHYNIQLDEERKQKEISVQIPVNLRRSFPSNTLRNFSLCYSVKLNPNMGEYSFEEMLNQVKLYLRLINNPKELNAMMTANMGLEKNYFMRAMPLFIKKIGIGISFLLTGEQTTSALLTNLGAVTLPDEMAQYVEKFMLMAGPGVLNGARVGAVSYNDTFAATFANIYEDSRIEREFFSFLVKRGIHVKIESNRN